MLCKTQLYMSLISPGVILLQNMCSYYVVVTQDSDLIVRLSDAPVNENTECLLDSNPCPANSDLRNTAVLCSKLSEILVAEWLPGSVNIIPN